jgi:thioredoxin reductase (NADPH)
MSVEQLVIIGSGPAGFTAAIYAARADLNPVVISGLPLENGGGVLGGQLTTTTEVENFPGFEQGVSGPVLMETMQKQAERFGTRVVQEHIIKADLASRPFELTDTKGNVIKALSLIIATGASARYLGLPSEQRLKGRGVSACATCDGFFFRGREIHVAGGGDTAMEEAIFLTRFASKVTVIHRRDEFRASAAMLKKARENSKLEFLTPYVIEEVLGKEKVEGLKIKNVVTAEIKQVSSQGLFLGIGHTPNTAAFVNQVDLDEAGYITADHRCRVSQNNTIIPGVFAAGDVADHLYRQAVTAAGSGCAAALEAQRFLQEN